jgi:hypothetical protein
MTVPFTMVETISFNTACTTQVMSTVSEWRTAWVRGTPYPAPCLSFSGKSPVASFTYTFNDLFLNMFEPGDIISEI